jgi:thiaminase
MTDFSQKRFVDLGQTLYTEWLKTCSNMQSATEQERREIFKFAAEMSFEAVEEFAKVFRHQEDK